MWKKKKKQIEQHKFCILLTNVSVKRYVFPVTFQILLVGGSGGVTTCEYLIESFVMTANHCIGSDSSLPIV